MSFLVSVNDSTDGLCPETVWHSGSKERLGKFRVLRHGVQYVQFCCVIVIIIITVIGG